jgi:serine/threonine protein kinase
MPSTAADPSTIARTAHAPGGDLLEGSSYRTLGPLGAGGMGEVLEAEHRALGHRVVVKVLREELAVRRDMLDRMRVEAQALARIRHPHLVMVTDFGHTRSGRPFLVMERLSGRSLREEMFARRVLPVAEAAEIGRQILMGLSAAHAAGLVHRDIKPDNVFLCASEGGGPLVKVLDFGIVKIVQAGRDPRTPAPLLVPTAANVTLGTPRYFSPEQARGARDLDGRSDLYSVALVLYEMVAARGPFYLYQRYEELVRAHTTEAPMPLRGEAQHQPIPPRFERIVMRALAKPREERFPDALAFAEALSRFLGSLGAERGRITGRSPLSEEEQDTVDLEDCPAPEDPTATASPVVMPQEGLPAGPVMIDNLVQRVLGGAAPGFQAPTAPSTLPAPLAGSDPGRASRPSVPETAPMFELGPTAPMRPVPSSLAPVQTALHPTASAPTPAPAPLVPAPVAGGAWKVPVIAAAAALLVLIGVLLGYLLR